MTTTEKSKASRGRVNSEVGVVISDKMDKTISVQIYRLVKHARYSKFIRKTSVFKAHDEKNEAKVGDTVRIYETRPMSKMKRWKLAEVVQKAGLLDEVQI
ncbi:MAG: 30S ribosomal protein S17 [Bdellovibrionales bacterium]|nr:30S ribosomal protein S17 [Bdellovibrionales bacterium]